jgi:plasmid transfer factor, traG
MIHIDLWTVFCFFLMLITAVFTVKPSVLGLTFCSIVVLILNFTVSEDVALIGLITPFVAFSLLTAILIHFCKKYEDGNKQGSYKKYAKMGLISDEGVVIGQYDTILSGVVPPLTKILPADKRTAAYNWFVERHMNPMPLYLRDNSSNHILIEGESNHRRSDRFIIPTLLDGWKSSVVVHDIKGEYWEVTAGYRKRLGNTIIKFEPTATDDTSACWNPLDEIRMDSPDKLFVAKTLSSALIRMGKMMVCDDVVEEVADVLTKIILHLKNTYHADQDRHPKSLSLYDVAQYIQDHTVGMVDKDGAPVYAWMPLDWKIYDTPLEYPYISLEEPEKVQKIIDHKLHGIVSIPNNQACYILSIINAALKDYLDPVLRHHTERSDFCIKDLMNHTQPVSLYLVTPPGNSCQPSPIFRVFLEMLWIFGYKGEPMKGRYRCLILMDECTSLGRLNIFGYPGLNYISLCGMKAVLFDELLQTCKFYGCKTDMQVISILGKKNKYSIIMDDRSVDVAGVQYQENDYFLSRMYEAPERSEIIHGHSI